MPPNRCLIDSKWVFKKKSDGQFWARLLAQGHTQISGLEFTQNYSPVVTDATLCVILLMWLINKWYSQNIYVETLFLYALLQEEIYTKIPEGMSEVIEEHYIYKYISTLIKCIHGLLQAVRFWLKEYIEKMTLKVGFKNETLTLVFYTE